MKDILRQYTSFLSITLGFIFFTFILLPPLAVQAATKDTIEFKSTILNQDTQPVADGSYKFKFILYDSAQGGTLLWSEERTLNTRLGGFDVDLGAITPFPPAVFANSNSLYLQICLDLNGIPGDGSGDCADRYEEQFTTRKFITSVPWAARAFALGPVTIPENGTGYDINVFGGNGTLANFNYNSSALFSFETNGNLMFTAGGDIFFGNSSLRSTTGAGLIGVNNSSWTKISGNNVQQALDSINSQLNGGSEIDPVWVGSRDSNATAIAPTWTFNSTLNTSTVIPRSDGSYDLGSTTNRYANGDFKNKINIGATTSTVVTNLNIDSTTDITPVGGTYNAVNINTKYTPSAGTSTEEDNAIYYNSIVNAGDGSNIARQRGIRGLLTNNTTGTGNMQQYGISLTDTNNTHLGQMTVFSGSAVNNGTIDALYGAAIAVVNNGTTGHRSSQYNLSTTNNGTYNGADDRFMGLYYTNSATGDINQFYGIDMVSHNSGVAHGGWYAYWNNMENSGTTNGGTDVAINNFANTGTINADISSNFTFSSDPGIINGGDFSGLKNNVGTPFLNSYDSNVDGNIYGIQNNISAAGGPTTTASQNMYGSATRITGDVFAGGNMYGNYNDISPAGNANDIYGIYNSVQPTGSYSNKYGMYSTDGATSIYLNYNAQYSLFTNNLIRLDGGEQFGPNAENSLSLAATSAPSSNLYYGDMIVCDTSQPNCGRGGSASAAGSTGEVQFNNGSSSFAANSNFFWDDTNNRLGIHTNTPNNLLQIETNDNTNGYGMTISGDPNNAIGISFENRSAGANPWYLFSTDNGNYANGGGLLAIGNPNFGEPYFVFGLDTNLYPPKPRMGIGVSDMQASLDIRGATDSSASLRIRDSGGVNPSNLQSGDFWWNGSSLYFYDGSTSRDLLAGGCGTCFVNEGNSFGGTATLGTNDNNSLNFVTNNLVRTVIDTSGNFGINTTSPQTTLDVAGAARIAVGASGTIHGYDTLHLSNDVDPVLSLEAVGSGAGYLAVNSADNTTILGAENNIQFKTGVDFGSGPLASGSTIMFVDNSDIVGIGGTNYASSIFAVDADNETIKYYYNQFTADGSAFDVNSFQTVSFATYNDITLNSGRDLNLESSNDLNINSGTGHLLNIGGLTTPAIELHGTTIDLDVSSQLNVNGPAVFNGQTTINSADLLVTNGALCVDGGTGCPALSAGGIYGDLAYSEFDVAENILAASDVESGNIVSPLQEQDQVVRNTTTAYEDNFIGVISTNPGSIGGIKLKARDGFKVEPLSLAGRIPVKVNTENGPIVAGDPITSSSTAGEGMKAITEGRIIGYALESFSGNGSTHGKIVVMLNIGYYKPKTAPVLGLSTENTGNERTPATIAGITRKETADEIIIGINSQTNGYILSDADLSSGKIVTIKDQSGVAGTKPLTIFTAGNATIDGLNSFWINKSYGVLKLYSDGKNWFTL